MNAIQVRFFASLREQIGRDRIDVAASGVTDIASLWRRLTLELPSEAIAALRTRGTRIAVNQELIEHNATLAPGDEVAFLPPITGG